MTEEEHHKAAMTVLGDFVFMANQEILRIKTGYGRISMRDCLGQWEATVREARELLDHAPITKT